jgi:hypothetical protein
LRRERPQTDEACCRASPTTPARSAAGPQDRARAAWDCECRVAARTDCPSFPSRTARADRAHEARRDQDQVFEIPGFEIQETGDNRKDRADRQRFPASTGLQSQRGRNIDSLYVLSKIAASRHWPVHNSLTGSTISRLWP